MGLRELSLDPDTSTAIDSATICTDWNGNSMLSLLGGEDTL